MKVRLFSLFLAVFLLFAACFSGIALAEEGNACDDCGNCTVCADCEDCDTCTVCADCDTCDTCPTSAPSMPEATDGANLPSPYMDDSHWIEVSDTTLNEKKNSGDAFVVMIYRDGCFNCAHNKSVISRWLETGSLDVYGMECDTFNIPYWVWNAIDSSTLPFLCVVDGNGNVTGYTGYDAAEEAEDAVLELFDIPPLPEELPAPYIDDPQWIEASAKTVNKKVKNGDSFTVLFYSTNCSNCGHNRNVITGWMDTRSFSIYGVEIDTFGIPDWVWEALDCGSVTIPVLCIVKGGDDVTCFTGYDAAEEAEDSVFPEVTLSFDAGKGTGAPASEALSVGDTYCLTGADPTRNGYLFMGWSPEKEGKTADYKTGDCIVLNNNLTLYAVWRLIGDTDNSGTLTATDLIGLSKELSKNTSEFPAYLDVTGDGVFDLLDLVSAMKALANKG